MRHHSSLEHALSGGEGLEAVSVESFALLMLLHGDSLLDVNVESADLLLGFGRRCLDSRSLFVDDEDEAAPDVGVLVEGDLHVLDIAVLAEMLA